MLSKSRQYYVIRGGFRKHRWIQLVNATCYILKKQEKKRYCLFSCLDYFYHVKVLAFLALSGCGAALKLEAVCSLREGLKSIDSGVAVGIVLFDALLASCIDDVFSLI